MKFGFICLLISLIEAVRVTGPAGAVVPAVKTSSLIQPIPVGD